VQFSERSMVIVHKNIRLYLLEMRSVKIIACLVLLVVSNFDSSAQDDRTFWQKLFGKKKSEQIDTETPKNSQDSLAVLIQGHLTPVDTTEVIEKEPELTEPVDTVIKDVPNGKGVVVHVAEEIITYTDTVTSIKPSGYRIQVYLGELNQARRIRSALIAKGERATMDYNRSDYIVRVGDYRTYMEAEKALLEIKKNYPYAHVIKDKIEI